MKSHSLAKFFSFEIWEEVSTTRLKVCLLGFWNQPIALWFGEYRDIDHIFDKSLFLFCALFSSCCKYNYKVKWEEKHVLFWLVRVACRFQLALIYWDWYLNQFQTVEFSSWIAYSFILIFFRRKKYQSLHCLPSDFQRQLHNI